MKKIYAIAALLVAAAGFLSSCNDKEEPEYSVILAGSELGLSNTQASYNTLVFTWSKDVYARVNQCGYKLTDPSGAVVAEDVTQESSVSITDLDPDTKYTFTLYAYYPTEGEAESFTTYWQSISAATAALKQLATPELIGEQVGPLLVVSWQQIEDAQKYLYSYYTLDGELVEGETEECSISIGGLPVGDYSITVQAVTEEGGFINSYASSVTINRHRAAIWSVTGQYATQLLRRNNKWNAVMTAYDDGSYIIAGFFGVEGYDLEFYIDDDTTLTPLNPQSMPQGYFYMATGNATIPTLAIWPYNDVESDEIYSTFTGDAAGGSLSYTAASTSALATLKTDTFAWPAQ